MNNSIKIINKSKEGLKFVPNGENRRVKPAIMSWEEFNKTFDFDKDDKTLAHLKPEWIKKYAEVDKLLDMAVMSVIGANASEGNPGEHLNNIATLGGCTTKIAEILGCSQLDATQLILQRKNLFINTSLEMGVSFDKCHHRMMDNDQIRKSKNNKNKIDKETSKAPETPKEDPYKCSIGDMINAKRK